VIKVFLKHASEYIEEIKAQTKITEEFVRYIQEKIMSDAPELVNVYHYAILNPELSREFYDLYVKTYHENTDYKKYLLTYLSNVNRNKVETEYMPFYYDCGCMSKVFIDNMSIGENGVELKMEKHLSGEDVKETLCKDCLKKYTEDCEQLNGVLNANERKKKKREALEGYVSSDNIEIYKEINKALCLLYADMKIPVETLPLLLNINPTVDFLIKHAQYS